MKRECTHRHGFHLRWGVTYTRPCHLDSLPPPPSPTGGDTGRSSAPNLAMRRRLWVETKGPMVEPFALSRSELANSILVKKKKKRSSFVSSRDAFYLHRKNMSLVAENEHMRCCMDEWVKYTCHHFGEMSGMKHVLPYPHSSSL